MKLLSACLLLSLGITTAFCVAFWRDPTTAPPALRGWFSEPDNRLEGTRPRPAAANATTSAPAPKPSSTSEAAKLWSAFTTADLPTLVAQLRAAGFPPHVIRAIVSVRIDEMFAPRLAAFRQRLDDTPYWQPSPTHYMRGSKWLEEQQQIFRDRSRLMRQVLGDDFLARSGDVTAEQRRQYGDLPKAKIDQVQQINDDYAEMISQVRAAAQGILLPEDREKIAYLEREKRADLARVLTPQELEDHEMRTSMTTMRLRQAMTLMGASEEEFRRIYAVRKPFDDEFNTSVPGVPRTDHERRRAREAEVNQQLKSVLGEGRAADFTRASNYEFQQLAQLTSRENLPLSAAVKAFEIRSTSAEASWRIAQDQAMPREQKLEALKAVADKAKFDLSATLGPAGAAYAESASWLQTISRGGAVRFEGTTTMFRSAVTSPAPPPPATRPAPLPGR